MHYLLKHMDMVLQFLLIKSQFKCEPLYLHPSFKEH